MKEKKTIFITCFFGLIARDILGTRVFSILRSRNDLKIVILVPENKKQLYQGEFAGPNVTVEGIPEILFSLGERIAHPIFRDLLNTDTRRIQRLVQYKRTGKLGNYLLGNFLAFLGGWPAVVKLARLVFASLKPQREIQNYFKKYKPDLLFATDIMVVNDIRFMRVAQRKTVPTIGMVRSWDNLTIYGVLPVIPDRIIVQNEPIARELSRYQFVRNRPVEIVGIPHYDEYREEPRTPRDQFLKNLGLDSKKKTILFVTGAIKHWGDPETNIRIVETLASFDANIIVRLPVMGEIELGNLKIPDNIILDKPVRTKESVDAILNKAAAGRLADLLFASDVVVVGASTIMIDAAIFKKPVVYVDFDANPTPYWNSAERLKDYNHIRTILNTGAVHIAKNLLELHSAAGAYLANPKLDGEARQALVEQKCWRLDGQAAERLADVILKMLDQQHE